jgi:invasion protein IalB
MAVSLAIGLGALDALGASGLLARPAAAASSVPTPTPRPVPDAGTVAANAPADVPKVTNKKTFGDRVYSCLTFADGKTHCSIAQTLTSSQTKKPVFQWRIAQDDKGGFVGIWQTPTGVLVNHGIVLDIGTPKPITIPFEYCAPGGCEAVGNLASDFIAILTTAQKASATLYGRDGKGISYPFSVKGLSAGLAALK